MAATYILISALAGDRVPGVEISSPESPVEWADLPRSAQSWAVELGYGSEGELLYVADESAAIPLGFEWIAVGGGA